MVVLSGTTGTPEWSAGRLGFFLAYAKVVMVMEGEELERLV